MTKSKKDDIIKQRGDVYEQITCFKNICTNDSINFCYSISRL